MLEKGRERNAHPSSVSCFRARGERPFSASVFVLRMQRMEEELDYSSGCESGWTMYLDQSASLPARGRGFSYKNGGKEEEEKEEEEEDLSMVSDASSGPPLFHEDEDYFDENGCFCSPPPPALAKKVDKRRRLPGREQEKRSSLMDDTASSHLLSFSKSGCSLANKKESMEEVLDFSIGFSATHFEGKSSFCKQYSFVQKTISGKTIPAKPIGKDEKRSKLW